MSQNQNSNRKPLKSDMSLIKTQAKIQNCQQKMVGHWNEQEHQKYVIFLDFFKKQLSSKQNRKQQNRNNRNNKMFKVMSQFIDTRNPIQCRNHHTKLIRTFRTIKNIVKDFKQKIGILQFSQAQKIITSNHRLFDRSSKQFKELMGFEILKPKTRKESLGIQTDYTVLSSIQKTKQEQNAVVSNTSIIQPVTFHFYPGPFVWLNTQ